MKDINYQYVKLVKEILEERQMYGVRHGRTEQPYTSVLFREIEVDCSRGFPALSLKRLWFKGVVAELLWFLDGNTNAKWLEDRGVNIWAEWGPESREMGPIYGHCWRNWGGSVDQVAQLIHDIKTNPNSRRMLVCAWNPSELKDAALPPCHMMFQVGVDHHGVLHMHVHQRSCDVFLGLPFNVASYALLLYMLARVTGCSAGRLSIKLGDAHIYNNHVEQAQEIVRRWEVRQAWPAVGIAMGELTPDLRGMDNIDDFKLVGYEHAGKLDGEVAV